MTKILSLFLFFFSFSLFPQSYKQLCADYVANREAGNRQKTFEIGNTILKKHAKEVCKDAMQYSDILNGMGNHYFDENKFDSCIANYTRAVNTVYSVKADTSFDYAMYLHNAAYVQGLVGNYQLSETYYLTSLPRLAKFLEPSSKEYSIFYKQYVEMKIEKGDYEAAAPLNDHLLHYFKTVNGENDVYYLNCINNKARIYQGLGDYSNAAPLFMQALYKNQVYYPEDTVNITTSLNNAAECYRMMGDYATAEPLYMAAYKLNNSYSKTTNQDQASLLNNMGLLYKAKSDYSQSEKCFLKSLECYKKANYQNNVECANPHNNLGDLYRLMGNYKMAIHHVAQAAEIRRLTSGEDHEYYANALINYALLLMDLEQLDDAELLLLRAEQIYKARLGENNLRYANCLSNLSSLYQRKKNYTKALDYKTRCLKLMEANGAQETDRYATYLSGKGSIESQLKDYDQAIKTYQTAATIFRNNFGSKDFNYLDMIYSMAQVYELAQNPKEARNHYLRSMYGYKKIIEDNFISMSEEEKTDFYYAHSHRLQCFYSFVIRNQKDKTLAKDDSLTKALFDIRMMDKSLLLSESTGIYSSILNSNDTIIKQDFIQWLEQKKYLHELYKYSSKELEQNNIDIDKEEGIKNDLEKKLNQSSSVFKKLTAPTDNFALLKSKLGKTDLAIDIISTSLYDLNEKPYYDYAAMIIGKDYNIPKIVVLDSAACFDSIFINHYKQCIQNEINDNLSYNRFYKALEKYINGITNIYFSPDGIYQQLNLYTLFNPATNKYLLETTEITQVNSLKDLFNNNELKNNVQSISLFGYPNYELKSGPKDDVVNKAIASRYGFTDLPELPGTKKETEDIAAVFKAKKWDTNLYLSNDATEEQVKKLVSPTILHIATHGFFLPNEDLGDEKVLGFEANQSKQNPLLRSGLMMAGAAAYAKDSSISKKEDGILNAYEASLLNLQNTELVTLSACETGLGELSSGQGVYGLQRAFLTAGAKSILMSLWVVDDNATQELMTEFYKDWLNNYTLNNKRASLRKAQLAIKAKYPNPYYWGAFVMIGK